MLVKEGEAKFKYCPYLKTHDDKMKFCQGSMCMMWRLKDADAPDGPGYCGLAGVPAGAAAEA